MDPQRPAHQEQGALSGALAARLRRAIIGGEFEPGARLHIDQLRMEFGVSLSPLREALMGLCAERLVETEAQRGFRIPPVSENGLQEITRLRVALETMALTEAIQRGDLAWESAIAAALHRLKRTGRAPSGEGLEEWEAAHRAFHMSLLTACSMPLLLHFCSVLHDHSDRYRRMFLKTHSGDRDVPGEHERIAELTMVRDAEKACALLSQHIERTGENVRIALTAHPHANLTAERIGHAARSRANPSGRHRL